MKFLNTLSRSEMKEITGGGTCKLYCCTGGPGTCSNAFAEGETQGQLTNEQCQSAGLSQGLDSHCPDGSYLAALYFS